MDRSICILTSNQLEGTLLAEVLEHELGAEVSVVLDAAEAIERGRRCDAVCLREPAAEEDRVVLIRRFLAANPELRVIVLEGQNTLGPLTYLEAGATAYLRSEETSDRLVESVRAALAGMALLDPAAGGQVVHRLQELSRLCVDQGVDIARCSRLTDREREIAARLARHLSNVAIASDLGVAVGTVKSHVHNILKKLDVETRTLAGVYWRIYEQGDGRPAARLESERDLNAGKAERRIGRSPPARRVGRLARV